MSPRKYRTVQQFLTQARRDGRRSLTEPETKKVLALAGIPVSRERLVRSVPEAVEAAHELGFPVVLKIVSPDIPHKSEAGGVRIGLQSPQAVTRAHREILASVKSRCSGARIEGILVQEAVQGLEVIVGTLTDPQFGPVAMFGLGGVFVEALEDVAFRIIPLSRKDAREMLDEIKGAPLLNGFRGSPPANKENIARILLSLSDLAGRFRDSIREIDINPLLVAGDRAVAGDGLLILH